MRTLSVKPLWPVEVYWSRMTMRHDIPI